MSEESYQEGYEDGYEWQVRARERETFDILTGGDDPPRRSGDDDYNRSVKDGIDAAR